MTNPDEHLTALMQTVLSRRDKARLQAHARQQHRTPSALVRMIVLDWMAEQDHKQEAQS